MQLHRFIMLDRSSPSGALESAPVPHGRVVRVASPPRRVLLAEDDEEMRSMLVRELRRDGYDVLQAADGAETAALIRELLDPGEAPDIIVMDIRMPSRTGLELLADLRKRHWRAPVILITAFGDSEIHDTARQLGAVCVFDKPFDVDDLRTAILNFLPPAPTA
jgi:two-component system response regulator (stage 0 sporulation protein F)